MARVTIEISDRSDGKFSIVATPGFQDLAKKATTGIPLTPAEVNAVLILRRIHNEYVLEKKTQGGSKLWLPDAMA